MTILQDDNWVQTSRTYWNNLASSFDNEPDHGLRDPIVLQSWRDFLSTSLPYNNAAILDIGCGTGSLSVVLAGLGHKVTGIDLSPEMVSIAESKASKLGFEIEFHVEDAASLRLRHHQFEAIVCRHLLWTLPEPKQVLQRWAEFLKPNGRLILIEGYWGSGGGLHANEIIEMLPACLTRYSHQNLAQNPNYWGKQVNDERYAIIADKTE